MSANPLRVLVVEGEDSVAQAIAGVLRRRGHVVTLASDARAALSADRTDVLISDLVLPGASGLELLEELQHNGHDPLAIFLGTRPTLDDSRRALELGAVELLSKPFRLAELVRAVESRCRPLARAALPAARLGGFDQEFPSAPASVELAAREIAAFAMRAGITPAARARIAGAVSEVVDNARRHGYRNTRGRIRVEAHLDGGDFVVQVTDSGGGFDAAALDAQGLHDTLRHGLARARALAEELAVESHPERGTRVTLSFRVSRVGFEEELAVDLSELDFLSPDLSRRVLQSLSERGEGELFHLSPALAVVIGRLLAGPDPRPAIEKALWS